MRMWLIHPKLLCRQHLLGEHKELHMLLGCLSKNKNIDGFILKGQVCPARLRQRHDQIVREMLKRGYNHKTPITYEETKYYEHSLFSNNKININRNILDLAGRCKACQEIILIDSRRIIQEQSLNNINESIDNKFKIGGILS